MDNPIIEFLLGFTPDKIDESKDLHKEIDEIIRKSVKLNTKKEGEELEVKIKEAKNKFANLISKCKEQEGNSCNPFIFIILPLLIGSNFGFDGFLTDKEGNSMPKDVFKYEYMPLIDRLGKVNLLIKSIESITEENSQSLIVPSIVGHIFALKDDLLEFLNKQKDILELKQKQLFKKYHIGLNNKETSE